MNIDLQKATKKSMSYTEIIKRCDKCKYHIESDDPYLERSWIDECTYSNLGKFRIEKYAYCKFFEKGK